MNQGKAVKRFLFKTNQKFTKVIEKRNGSHEFSKQQTWYCIHALCLPSQKGVGHGAIFTCLLALYYNTESLYKAHTRSG